MRQLKGLLFVEGLVPKPVRADISCSKYNSVGLMQSYFEHGVLTQSYFEHGVWALVGFGYQSFYIQKSLVYPFTHGAKSRFSD